MTTKIEHENKTLSESLSKCSTLNSQLLRDAEFYKLKIQQIETANIQLRREFEATKKILRILGEE